MTLLIKVAPSISHVNFFWVDEFVQKIKGLVKQSSAVVLSVPE